MLSCVRAFMCECLSVCACQTFCVLTWKRQLDSTRNKDEVKVHKRTTLCADWQPIYFCDINIQIHKQFLNRMPVSAARSLFVCLFFVLALIALFPPVWCVDRGPFTLATVFPIHLLEKVQRLRFIHVYLGFSGDSIYRRKCKHRMCSYGQAVAPNQLGISY